MKGRKWKRTLGMLLAAVWICISLAGCSKGGGGESKEGGDKNQAMGRFLEEEFEMGGEISSIFDMRKLEDGRLCIIGMNGVSPGVWELAEDGETVQKIYDFPTEMQSSANGWVNRAAFSPDGQIVCAFEEETADGFHSVLYLIDKEGKTKTLPLELPELKDDLYDEEFGETSNRVDDIQFPVNDWVVLQDKNGTVFQLNTADGSVEHKYDIGSVMGSFRIFAMGYTLIAQEGDQTILYDMKTGEQKQPEEALNKGGSKEGSFWEMDTLDGGESVYCLSGGGLYHYKFGGSVMEQLIDGSMNTLGTPDFYPIVMAMLDEQNLLVISYGSVDTEGPVIYKYAYSADVPAKPDKELKMYSLYENETIRDTINRFRKEHPDVYVNYQVALTRDNGMTVSDALKTLTTEIMAGNGPDLLLLDGMPVQTYIEKGVLKDLRSLVEESDGSYFEHIINAYEDEKGQLCAVPTRFYIPMIQAGSKYYSPGEGFDEFTERKDTMTNMRPKNVVAKFWYTCGAAWRKEDGTLDEAKVKDFLIKLKNGYGEYDSNIEEYETEDWSNMYLSNGDYELLEGNWNTNFGLCGHKEYGFELAINEKVSDGCVDLMPGQADHVFVPFMVLGVSSKSAQPQIAEEFVKYLLSEEKAQGFYTMSSGFPVEKELFRSAVDGHIYEKEPQDITTHLNNGEAVQYFMRPTPQEEVTRMTELAQSLTTPAYMDDVIKEVVVEQGVKVLKEELSPEEGAAAIIQKVNIYLAE